jgi:hypothetical protein
VKNIGLIILALWILGIAPVAEVRASEAQAAPMGGVLEQRYVIPAELSPEEQRWFKTFQEGNLLAEGWQSISSEILAKTPLEQKTAQKVALDNLGTKIGVEWSRPNSVRKVNSTMLREWGDILRQTARDNPQLLAQALETIDKKVDAVLD